MFYRKGDYYRYLAEFQSGDEKRKASENSLEAYKNANDHAEKLPSTHPIRLGYKHKTIIVKS